MRRHFLSFIFLFLISFSYVHTQQTAWTPMSGKIDGTFQCFFSGSTDELWGGTSQGLFLSMNNGETWDQIGALTTMYVNSIVRANDGSLVSGMALNDGIPRIYRSTNNGTSWTGTYSQSSALSIVKNSGGALFANRGPAILQSTDHGMTWTVRTIMYNSVRRSITAIVLNSDDSLFAVTQVGVFRSGNGGINWTHLTNGFPDRQGWSLVSDTNGTLFAGSDSCVFVSTNKGNSWIRKELSDGSIKFLASGPDNSVYAAIAGKGIFRSTDTGESWSSISSNLPNEAILSIASLAVTAAPSSQSVVLVGTNSGLYRSTDSGTTWALSSDGVSSRTVQSLSVFGNYPYSVLAGINGEGIFRFSTNSKLWIRTFRDSMNTQFNVIAGTTTQFAGTDSAGMLRSTDQGEHWESSSTGLPSCAILAVTIPSGSSVVAGTDLGIYRSTDNGSTWSSSTSAIGTSSVQALITIPPDTLFAGTSNGLFISTDGGTIWTEKGFSGKSVAVLAGGFNGELFAGTSDGIFLSLDNGTTWNPTGTVGTNASIRDIASSFPQTVVAATDQGVFLSTDNGATWGTANSGLPQLDVRSVEFMGSDILAGTSSGVFINSYTPPIPWKRNEWMAVGSLNNWYSDMGSEVEEGFVQEQQYGLQWPALSPYQDMQVAKGLWIGINDHTYADSTIAPYVVHIGPRAWGTNEFFPVSFTTISSFEPPAVTVDGVLSSGKEIGNNSVDTTQRADRMIVNVVNTAAGITMTRRIMQFGQQYHDNYIITDYEFKNTGNINADPVIEYPNTDVSGVYFYFLNRYAICAYTRYVIGQNPTGWGINTMIDERGDGQTPVSTFFPGNKDNDIRSIYAWHGKYLPFTKYDNIGGPLWMSYYDRSDTVGRLGAAQFAGTATIHADKSAADTTDDGNQPSTMSYEGSDEPNTTSNNHLNSVKNSSEYLWMKKGRVSPRFADMIGPTGDPANGTPGGYSTAAGYGPYTLNHGESVHIIVAEAAAGLSREACISIGEAFKQSGGSTSALIQYRGTSKTKNEWVYTGRDSLFQTFRHAIANVQSGYTIPHPPLPPKQFSVSSAAGSVLLTWELYTNSTFPMTGFEIYRAEGRIDSTYYMIYSCGPDVRSYADESVSPGSPYYYYIVSVGDSVSNTGVGMTPPGALRSNRYYTQTYDPVSILTTVQPGGETPKRFALEQNFPNPFNPSTTFRFDIASRSTVTLKIYDALGREVATLVNESMDPGTYHSLWNAGSFASGVYYYRLSAGSFVQTRKLLLLK